MTPPETEAYELGLEMSFLCSPERHSAIPESESVIERSAGDLPGTAAFVRSFEGTFLVLEAYDQNQAGHCLVLAWFGVELDPGRYPVERLGMATMEEQVASEEHTFFTFSAVRAATESATFVTDSGSVEIEAMDRGTVTGSFELAGFTINTQERVDDVVLEGSFTAVEREP